MNNAFRRRIFFPLFGIWCIALSLVLNHLLMPWAQVVVTAGIVFVIAGSLIGLFEPSSTTPKVTKPEALVEAQPVMQHKTLPTDAVIDLNKSFQVGCRAVLNSDRAGSHW